MISESIDVNISAAEAYRLVSDPRNYGRWSPEATGASFTGDFPLAEGSRFTGQNKLWLPWTGACQVVKADGTTFAFDVKIAGIRISRWSYIVEAAGSGARITERWDDLRTGLLGNLMKPAGMFVGRGTSAEKRNAFNIHATLTAIANDVNR
ncbi:MAG: SRPBCC family protein [Mycobacterium sp.]